MLVSETPEAFMGPDVAFAQDDIAVAGGETMQLGSVPHTVVGDNELPWFTDEYFQIANREVPRIAPGYSYTGGDVVTPQGEILPIDPNDIVNEFTGQRGDPAVVPWGESVLDYAVYKEMPGGVSTEGLWTEPQKQSLTTPVQSIIPAVVGGAAMTLPSILTNIPAVGAAVGLEKGVEKAAGERILANALPGATLEQVKKIWNGMPTWAKVMLVAGGLTIVGLVAGKLIARSQSGQTHSFGAKKRARRLSIGRNPRVRTLLKVSKFTDKIIKQEYQMFRHAGLIRIPGRTQYRRRRR